MTVSMTSMLDVSRPSGDLSSGAWAPRNASPGLLGSSRLRRQGTCGRECPQGAEGSPLTRDPGRRGVASALASVPVLKRPARRTAVKIMARLPTMRTVSLVTGDEDVARSREK